MMRPREKGRKNMRKQGGGSLGGRAGMQVCG